METSYVTPEQAAEIILVKPTTLAKWRSLKFGPQYRKIGKRILYVPAELYAWVEAQTMKTSN